MLHLALRRKIKLSIYYLKKAIKLGLLITICLLFYSACSSDTIKTLFVGFIQTTLHDNLKIKNVVIENSKNTDTRNVLKCIAKYQKFIVTADLHDIRSCILRSDPFVKECTVGRFFPNIIHIYLKERRPIAIWQNKNQLSVIDNDGLSITNNVANFTELIHIVGDNANYNIHLLIKKIEESQFDKKLITAAIMRGKRRWDLILQGNVMVKLPELNLGNAFVYLNKLHSENKLLNNNINSIDLRSANKYYISYNKSI